MEDRRLRVFMMIVMPIMANMFCADMIFANDEVEGIVRIMRFEPGPPLEDRPILEDAEAELKTAEDSIAVKFETSELGPGDAYTIWWIINQPGKFRNTNGSSVDIVMLAGGDFADDHGELSLELFLPFGILPNFNANPDTALGIPNESPPRFENHEANIYRLVVRTHGPPQANLEEAQITTFGGGCNNTSLDRGPVGNYTCFDPLEVLFQ